MRSAELHEPRAVCPHCRRPETVCYCAALPRLETRTPVVILQHPREREHPIGTARMASLCLPGTRVLVGVDWSANPQLERAVGDPARPPILLYPGPGARDILRDPPPGPVTLVVVDGTWSQTRRVVRDNPRLRALPAYAFDAPEASEYRIRREPRAEYCSTIEALMHVLGVLEDDPLRFRALLAPFRAMVDAHLARRAAMPCNRIRTPRQRRSPRSQVLGAIAARWDDLVCVVGEANAWPYRDRDADLSDELVHWVARRPATGETFDVIAAPRLPLSPSTTMHTGLAEDVLAAGVARDQLFDAFARFVGPRDLVCAWGNYPMRLFTASGGQLPEGRLDLRASAQRMEARKLGSLEIYAANAGLAAGDERPPGRAGLRLELVTAVLRSWHAQSVASARS